MSQTLKLKPLTIPNGAAVSNALLEKDSYEGANAIMLMAPAAIGDAHTYTIEVTDDANGLAGATWRTLQDDTPTDIAPPLAGKARFYTRLPAAGAFRIKESANSTSDKVWQVFALYND